MRTDCAESSRSRVPLLASPSRKSLYEWFPGSPPRRVAGRTVPLSISVDGARRTVTVMLSRRKGGGGGMKKLVEIVDLVSGAITHRNSETLTLDVPNDLDWQTGGVSIDAHRIVRYFAAGAVRRLFIGKPRRLSGRTVGEECLVAIERLDTESVESFHRYALSVVR
jgi:hypothetical protein